MNEKIFFLTDLYVLFQTVGGTNWSDSDDETTTLKKKQNKTNKKQNGRKEGGANGRDDLKESLSLFQKSTVGGTNWNDSDDETFTLRKKQNKTNKNQNGRKEGGANGRDDLKESLPSTSAQFHTHSNHQQISEEEGESDCSESLLTPSTEVN